MYDVDPTYYIYTHKIQKSNLTLKTNIMIKTKVIIYLITTS